MLNVHELERRWLRYKIKHIIPIAVSATSFVVVLVLAYVFWPQPAPKAVALAQEKPVAAAPAVATEKAIPAKNAVISPEAVKPAEQAPAEPVKTAEQVVLKPAMNFMRDIEDDTSKETPIVRTETVYQAPKTEPAPQPVRTAEEKPAVMTAAAPEPAEPKNISIKAKDTEKDLKDVIARFQRNNNPTLSLFLAKHYYSVGDYNNSYDYALKTNNINNQIDQSWIIFAKSLVKLGKKEEAIKTLRVYIKHSDSVEAAMLLEDIIKGSFK